MAYSPGNLLLLKEITAPVHWKQWIYISADTFTTVKAANYISNAQAMAVQVNDMIIIVDQTTPAMVIARILTVTSSGATMSQTGTAVAA
jgi:hypothetical protein